MHQSYWKTKDGRIIDIRDMNTNHIRSAIAMLEREGFVSLAQKRFYLTCKQPDGDAAQDAFSKEQDYVLNARLSPALDNLRAELKKREEQITALRKEFKNERAATENGG